MDRRQSWKAASAVLVILGLQLCGQQVVSGVEAAGLSGTFTTFAAAGLVTSINPAGAVTGFLNSDQCFLRASDGTFTTFSPVESVITYCNAITLGGGVHRYLLL